MKRIKFETYHPIVLYLAILLTALSIIGSIVIVGLSSSLSIQTHGITEKTSVLLVEPDAPVHAHAETRKEAIARADFKSEKFSSSVKPKLSECFNCGIVVSIRTIASTDGMPDELAENSPLNEHQLSKYLNAHQKNARLLTTSESAVDIGQDDKINAMPLTVAHIIDVRMRNGRHLQVHQHGLPQHKIGDKVRVINSNTISA